MDLGLAGAWLALDEQRALQGESGIHREFQITCRYVTLGTFESRGWSHGCHHRENKKEYKRSAGPRFGRRCGQVLARNASRQHRATFSLIQFDDVLLRNAQLCNFSVVAQNACWPP